MTRSLIKSTKIAVIAEFKIIFSSLHFFNVYVYVIFGFKLLPEKSMTESMWVNDTEND